MNHLITYKGKTKCISDWAKEFGLSRSTFRGRLARDWPMERIESEAIHVRMGREQKLIGYKGQYKTMREWAEEFGLNYDTFRRRFRSGWSIKEIESTPAVARAQKLISYKGKKQNASEWAKEFGLSFETFYGRRELGWSMERIESEAVQYSRCKLITYKGKTQSSKQWAEEFGLDENTFRYRYRSGWPMKRIESTPATSGNRQPSKLIKYKGKSQSSKQWAEEFGLKLCTFNYRYRQGWSMKEIEKESVNGKHGRDPRLITYKGKTQSSKQWAEEFGLDKNTFRYRYRSGWPMKRIESTPAAASGNRQPSKLIKYKGKSQSSKQWAEEFGLDENTFRYRYWSGWSMEEIEKTSPGEKNTYQKTRKCRQ
ncbi:hypothetical protein A3207_00810 [Candidatus Methanomassiliicoccus intestinalis]|uniref:Uncharacterized protein n=2 Tax=Candidatus Methanomassiliicoccus intestinalis TaxID=1406512 RepID=R9TAA0_METII|nr:hypothetical protein [Candidatus Methanomassiliicoccus intestinalis]AGN26308.1 hypothetical protein MMINT_09540 [Candidatus Methanomassiliicoccus intestinalis Issoire-Mx1]TQS84617.1 MAG: hypothetical protein A3207_00810 [Candidatus Methanomassiliicoccus intestinalis]